MVEALKELQKRDILHATRELITVLDRHGLIQAAHRGYGAAEAEYDRHFGLR